MHQEKAGQQVSCLHHLLCFLKQSCSSPCFWEGEENCHQLHVLFKAELWAALRPSQEGKRQHTNALKNKMIFIMFSRLEILMVVLNVKHMSDLTCPEFLCSHSMWC